MVDHIPRRHHVRNHLDHPRHGLDRINKSREQERGQKGANNSHLISRHLRLALPRKRRSPRTMRQRGTDNWLPPISARLPRKGTSKIKTPTSTRWRSRTPTTKSPASCPAPVSAGRSGVERSCSIVPISHSRATVSEARVAAIICKDHRHQPRHHVVLRFERAVVPDTHLRVDRGVGWRPARVPILASGTQMSA